MDVKSPEVVRAAGVAIAIAAVAGFIYGVLQNPKKSSDIVPVGVAMNGVDLSKLSAAAPVDPTTLADATAKPKAAKKKQDADTASDNPEDNTMPDVQSVEQAPAPSTPAPSNTSQPPY